MNAARVGNTRYKEPKFRMGKIGNNTVKIQFF